MLQDPRCFLWRMDGTAAGMFTLPPSAERFPRAIQIWTFSLLPENTLEATQRPLIYWQDDRCANMYRAST